MEIFINESSLEGQYHNQAEFTDGIKMLRSIFFMIKSVKDAKLYKEDLLVYGNAIREENFQSSLKKIRDKSLRIAFEGIIHNKLNAKNWKKEQVHSSDDIYSYFDKNEEEVECTDKTLAEISERNLQDAEKKRLAINFINSSFRELNSIAIFKNLEYKNPIEVDCCDNKIALEKWIGNIDTPATSFLRNKDRFEPTSRIAPKVKTKIYLEKATGYYWYFDNFHATEFEICDKQGKHIGVANLEGEIDFDAAKDGRSISKVL